ncbi:MAG: hypothetical protein WC322_05120 [Candidatus Paceibacterota bacterium]|jgi:hypothetical protein
MKVYVIADIVPEGCDYLTAGKEYEIYGEDKTEPADFFFTDNNGAERHSFLDSWLCRKRLTWQRVEREE